MRFLSGLASITHPAGSLGNRSIVAIVAAPAKPANRPRVCRDRERAHFFDFSGFDAVRRGFSFPRFLRGFPGRLSLEFRLSPFVELK